MSLLVGRYIQEVHLIKKKINLITIEEKIFKKSKENALEMINREEREMVPLTYEENNFYKDQEICYLCKEKFCIDKNDKNNINKRKVKDHYHYTGKFRGVTDNICNLNYSFQKEIPIIIHNATYDAHFILNQLAIEFESELNCFEDNMEKYITFSVPIKIYNL